MPRLPQDSLRYAVLDMLNSMGVKVALAMQIESTTHIVAKDVDDLNSEKLKAARAYVSLRMRSQCLRCHDPTSLLLGSCRL